MTNPASNHVQNTIEKERDLALRSFLDSRFSDAIDSFTKVISMNILSPDVRALRFRACCFFEVGDYDSAFRDTETLLEIDSAGFVNTKMLQGNCFLRLGRFRESLDVLDEILAHDPSVIHRVRKRKARVFCEMRHYELALIELSQILLENPDDVGARIIRAEAREDTGQYAEALEDYAAVIKGHPDTEYGYNNRGHLRILLEDYEGALDDLEMDKSLWRRGTLPRHQSSIFWRLSFVHCQLHCYQLAEVCLNQSYDLDPSFPKLESDIDWIPHLAGKFSYHLRFLGKSPATIALEKILKCRLIPLEELIRFIMIESDFFESCRVRIRLYGARAPLLVGLASWMTNALQ